MTDTRRKGAGSGLAAALARAAKAEATGEASAPTGPVSGDPDADRAMAGHGGAQGSERAQRGAKARDGKKLIGGHFAPEISTQLRILAAEDNTTVQALLEEAISDLLVKKGGVRRR